MKNKNKTKKQLINELAGMHKRLVKYETSEADYKRRKKLIFDTNRRLQETTQELFMAKKDVEEKNKELAQAAEEWKTTFNSITDLVSTHDKDFKLVRVNKALAEAVKTKPEELIGKTCYQEIHGTKKPHPNCPHKLALETKKPVRAEFFDSHLGIYLEISVSPIFNDKDEVVATVHIVKDITDRKQVDKLKDEFISTVSHELRTPLASVREGISQILDELLGRINKKQKESLFISLEDIDRLNRIIESLLSISKIESGKVELRKRFYDINSLVQKTNSSLKAEAENKNIIIKSLFQTETLDIFIDKDKMVQVLTNLLHNAIKYTLREGKVKVEIKEEKKEIKIIVKDTGIGIAPQDFDKIFDRFQQIKRVSGPGARGVGLGLPIVKELVQMHKGRIWVESSLGKGSRFIFTIPKYTPDEALKEYLKDTSKSAIENPLQLSLLAIRVANYREIEEACGENAAKKILKEIKAAAQETIRSSDMVSPYRKGEVVVILAGPDKQAVSEIRERMKAMVREHLAGLEIKDIKIDVRFGIAVYLEGADTDIELVKWVEESLMAEKRVKSESKILIVDDEETIITTVERFLRDEGFQRLFEALDGEEAVEIAKQEIPDLIILDMKLPKMDGYEIIGRLKENVATSDIPILILTGYPIENDKIKRYKKIENIPCLGKPVNFKALSRDIDDLLELKIA